MIGAGLRGSGGSQNPTGNGKPSTVPPAGPDNHPNGNPTGNGKPGSAGNPTNHGKP